MERAIDPTRIAVSPQEAAKMLGISRAKLYTLIHQDGFPSFRLGGRVLVSVDGLREWVAQQVEGVKA